ncbi:phosphatase [Anaerotalea alkaliphila]|uniref:Phosphatase n=1 Tax=Anaerotalea alkaliphila TaxID=2662126 RepID=A0A7X5HU21_9FIRM|nr:phosphatase [Anaerotalea alkaliphila]NDL66672.1 phosphatase [Anaerotalea alkaliphila]
MELLLDVHCHTVASGHAYSTLYENVRGAKERGLQVLGIADHGPAMPGSAYIFYFQNLWVVPGEIEGVRILKGVEANIVDTKGGIDMKPEDLKGLDYAIASLHSPCIRYGSKAENTKALVGAMGNPWVRIIGHPDDARYPLDYEELVRAAKDSNVLLELNNTSLSPLSFRQQADVAVMTILELSAKHNHPVIANSDAHIAFDVGNFGNVRPLLEESGFPRELVVNADPQGFLEWLAAGSGK